MQYRAVYTKQLLRHFPVDSRLLIDSVLELLFREAVSSSSSLSQKRDLLAAWSFLSFGVSAAAGAAASTILRSVRLLTPRSSALLRLEILNFEF